MWLDGSANSERSAICCAVAQVCSEQRRLSGGFSFPPTTMNPAGKQDASGLIATLIYQLLVHIPETRNFIAEKVAADISILDRSWETQLDALLIQPLAAVAQSGLLQDAQLGPRLFIIDGLDNCHDKTQCFVVEAFTTALGKIPKGMPHKLLFSSQSESQLVTTCRKASVSARLRRLHLDDSPGLSDGIKLSPVESFVELKGNISLLRYKLSICQGGVDELEKERFALERRKKEIRRKEEEVLRLEVEIRTKAADLRKQEEDGKRREERRKKTEEKRLDDRCLQKEGFGGDLEWGFEEEEIRCFVRQKAQVQKGMGRTEKNVRVVEDLTEATEEQYQLQKCNWEKAQGIVQSQMEELEAQHVMLQEGQRKFQSHVEGLERQQVVIREVVCKLDQKEQEISRKEQELSKQEQEIRKWKESQNREDDMQEGTTPHGMSETTIIKMMNWQDSTIFFID